MSLHPTLQRAKDSMLERRANRQRPDSQAVVSPYHRELLTACRPVGNGLYFTIRYCPDCLKGTVLDLVREVPEDMPDARVLVASCSACNKQKVFVAELLTDTQLRDMAESVPHQGH